MKRRVVTTYKILAVTVTAVTGCTAVEPSVRQGSEPVELQAPRDGDGYPLVGNMLRKGGQPPPERDAGSDAGSMRVAAGGNSSRETPESVPRP